MRQIYRMGKKRKKKNSQSQNETTPEAITKAAPNFTPSSYNPIKKSFRFLTQLPIPSSRFSDLPAFFPLFFSPAFSFLLYSLIVVFPALCMTSSSFYNLLYFVTRRKKFDSQGKPTLFTQKGIAEMKIKRWTFLLE